MFPPHHRKSWDTTVKHYFRLGIENNLPEHVWTAVPHSNRPRWRGEPDGKYAGCEVAAHIQRELELIKRVGQSSVTKKVLESYFTLCDTFFEITAKVKGIGQAVARSKDLVVSTVENLKQFVPVEKAIKAFNISRATYQNYKTLVMNKCDSSYFLWCVKKYPHQLLKREILTIKKYMEGQQYRHWSKSSVYLKATGTIRCMLPVHLVQILQAFGLCQIQAPAAQENLCFPKKPQAQPVLVCRCHHFQNGRRRQTSPPFSDGPFFQKSIGVQNRKQQQCLSHKILAPRSPYKTRARW